MSEIKIQYIPHDSPTKVVPVKMRHVGFGMMAYPGQGDDGYGMRITTDKKVEFKGRWYRVYATCFSNCASYWITVRGEGRLYLQG